MGGGDAVARGRVALESWAWAEALAAFREALEVRESPEALEGLATAASRLDDPVASEARERAYRLYRQRGDDEGAVRMAYAIAMDLASSVGEGSVAAGWVSRARSLLAGIPDSPWRAAIDGLEGYLAWAYDRDIPRALELTRSTLELATRGGDTSFQMLALAQLGAISVSAGNLTEGMRMLDQAAAAAVSGEMPDREAEGLVCCYMVTACARARDLDRAAQWSRHVMDLSRGWTDRGMYNFPRTEYAEVLIWWGRWGEAERELQEAIAEMAARPALAASATLRLTGLRRRQGRWEEAVALLDGLEERPNRSGLGPAVTAARAAVALDRGQPHRAAELADQFLGSIPAADVVDRIEGLAILAEARALRGDLDRAEACAKELSTAAARVSTGPILAMSSAAAGAVAAAQGDHVEARRAFERSIALFDESGVPFEAARARVRLSGSLQALGEADRAADEVRRARGTFERLGARAAEDADRLLARIRPGPRSGSPLTAREQEILRLVGKGRTNEEIAAELFLSVRTVERHVSNLYAKIGATGRAARAAATAYAHTHGLT